MNGVSAVVERPFIFSEEMKGMNGHHLAGGPGAGQSFVWFEDGEAIFDKITAHPLVVSASVDTDGYDPFSDSD